MFGINLKVLVAMVTEMFTHSISATACLHPAYSANFEKSKDTFFLKEIFFLKSINSVCTPPS